MALVDSLASESCTSLGSGSSGSSVETVVHSSDLKSKLLELQAVRASQDNVIAELRGKLNANERRAESAANDRRQTTMYKSHYLMALHIFALL
ncbi:hypothetical protein quinque_010970 [Culex quinquefasciatus]